MKWLVIGFLLMISASVRGVAADQEADIMGIRGGGLCVEPALLIPAGQLSGFFDGAFGGNLDFDIGASPGLSIVFGSGYYDFTGKKNRDAHMIFCPAWLGGKFKYHFLPVVELYWEMAGTLYYERAYYMRSSVGREENLDGGMMMGVGYDLWLSRWLVTGVDARYHLVIEPGQVFPMVQLGLRLGIRG